MLETSEAILLGLAAAAALGMVAQWLAWRFHFPAILLLLIAGFIAGPGMELLDLPRLDPQEWVGDLLVPAVSASVAIILFEGGLSLSLRELRSTGTVLWRLVTIGMVATWGIGTVATKAFTGLSWQLAFVVGAILVVSGPTVVGPLLRNVRPTGRVGAILRWEGILIDPIGAVLAVLTFEVIVDEHSTIGTIVERVAATAGVGTAIGLAAAAVLVIVIKQYLIPDFLHNAMSLAVVITAFTASDAIISESGLVAVTVAGIALANQRFVPVRHIIEFKETLRVLLISGLFIVLAATLDVDAIRELGLVPSLFFLIVLLGARPVAVYLSTLGSNLKRPERLFMASVAPRGIVAAAISSVLALDLAAEGHEGAEKIAPLVFLAIVGSIIASGLGAPRIARKLGVSDPNPQGALIVGANPLARSIASALKEHDLRVMLVDSDYANFAAARMAGLQVQYRSFLSEEVNHQTDLGGIGYLFAVTPNDELNALSVQHAIHLFGRASVFRLATGGETATPRMRTASMHTPGRVLFAEDLHYRELAERLGRGATVKKTSLGEEFGFAEFKDHYGDAALPLFSVSSNGKLSAFSVDGKPNPKAGDTIISLMDVDAPEIEPMHEHGSAPA